MSEPAKSTEMKYVPHNQLAVVFFKNSVNFSGSEMQSASVAAPGHKGSNAVDTIEPAVMLPSGNWRPILDGEFPHGLGLSRKQHNLHNGRREVARTFVPWDAVKCVNYRE